MNITMKAKEEVWIKAYEKTPKPLANHVNERTVTVTIPIKNPRACRLVLDMAPLHVAQVNSLSGV